MFIQRIQESRTKQQPPKPTDNEHRLMFITDSRFWDFRDLGDLRVQTWAFVALRSRAREDFLFGLDLQEKSGLFKPQSPARARINHVCVGACLSTENLAEGGLGLLAVSFCIVCVVSCFMDWEALSESKTRN